MGACDETSTADFVCGRLAAALKVAEATPDLEQRPELKSVFARVKRQLNRAGWNYPASPRFGDMESHVEDLHQLTEDLITALNQDRIRKRTVPRASSLLAEEYRIE